VLAAVAGALGLLLAWGLFAPRGQWRVLHGWATRDPDTAEPGDAVHGVRRFICAVGLLALLAVVSVVVWNRAAEQPVAAAPANAVERMWGTPTPRLIDRVVVPQGADPEGLVPSPVLAYQELDRGFAPTYLVTMPRYALLGDPAPDGLLGADPGDDFNAFGISDILFEVEGPLLCIPRALVLVDGETEVNVGVYWGLPGAIEQDHVAGCRLDGTLQRVLIPVQLPSELEGRIVVNSFGEPISAVEVDED